MDDAYSREIDYLRISITDRCNLRCLYCMPEEGVSRMGHSDILRYEEIVEIVEAGVASGIRKIRITGGEPLVRPGVVQFVGMLKNIRGVEELSITTNAVMLPELAGPLADAGLDRVNVSLDTLDPVNFSRITRVGRIEKVFEGINAAVVNGLGPVKINSVVIRGFNDHEVSNLSEWALSNEYNLRFIEYMPISNGFFSFAENYISSDEIKEIVLDRFPELKECSRAGNGPARYLCRADQKGSIGFIEAVSHAFCSNCNRLRLTADGKLKPCLFSNDETDLVPVLRNRDGDVRGGLIRLFRNTVLMKPESHEDFQRVNADSRCMNEIGG